MSDNAPDDKFRSLLLSNRLKKKQDKEQHRIINEFSDDLVFGQIDELLISSFAWAHVQSLGIEPKFVFAHPDILQAHPTTSIYYRGLALLSKKRVGQLAASVSAWEEGKQIKPVNRDTAKKVACVYNTMISAIIEGSSNWTLDNGYRNILATMGITLDGMFRNKIGSLAENLVKDRILSWVEEKKLILESGSTDNRFVLPGDTVMHYSSEPDIKFTQGGTTIATIEIKGGRDPAGALERLGAMSKSFAETPVQCVNFLVAGIITPAMQARLSEMNVKVFLLDDVSQDGVGWDSFTTEVFHHAVRVT